MGSVIYQPKVLLADDDVASLAALAMFFEIEGFEVRTAHDGLEAVDVYECWPPELVILDIDMPFIDGYAIARKIRRQDRAHTILLIAVTGRSSAGERQASIDAGFDHHIAKPARLDQIMRIAKTHVARLAH